MVSYVFSYTQIHPYIRLSLCGVGKHKSSFGYQCDNVEEHIYRKHLGTFIFSAPQKDILCAAIKKCLCSLFLLPSYSAEGLNS